MNEREMRELANDRAQDFAERAERRGEELDDQDYREMYLQELEDIQRQEYERERMGWLH